MATASNTQHTAKSCENEMGVWFGFWFGLVWGWFGFWFGFGLICCSCRTARAGNVILPAVEYGNADAGYTVHPISPRIRWRTQVSGIVVCIRGTRTLLPRPRPSTRKYRIPGIPQYRTHYIWYTVYIALR